MDELTITVKFADGSRLSVGPRQKASLQIDGREIPLPSLSDTTCAEVLGKMAGAGATLREAVELSGDVGDFAVLAAWQTFLETLCSTGRLRVVVAQGDNELLTVIPTSARFEWPIVRAPSSRVVLSRFAYFRREGDALLLESPKTHCRVVIVDERAARFVLSFTRCRELERVVAELGPTAQLGDVLEALGFLAACDGQGETADERGPLAPWEFHDLLFHMRSRRGRHARPMGGTYRFLGRLEPPPVVRDRYPGNVVPLAKPDLSRLAQSDSTLSGAMEARRSERTSGREPVSVEELGELLFRCVAVRRLRDGDRDQVSERPYPSGGARYPLEVYLAVRTCRGLLPGLYHYDALGHSLTLIQEMSPALFELLHESSVGPEYPQVLAVIAARFHRVTWKYETIAYSLILKESGVLTQSFYLVGTAMGLGICAVGHGASDRFSELAGTDPYVESSVAELVIGSRPESEYP